MNNVEFARILREQIESSRDCAGNCGHMYDFTKLYLSQYFDNEIIIHYDLTLLSYGFYGTYHLKSEEYSRDFGYIFNENVSFFYDLNMNLIDLNKNLDTDLPDWLK